MSLRRRIHRLESRARAPARRWYEHRGGLFEYRVDDATFRSECAAAARRCAIARTDAREPDPLDAGVAEFVDLVDRLGFAGALKTAPTEILEAVDALFERAGRPATVQVVPPDEIDRARASAPDGVAIILPSNGRPPDLGHA